MVEPLSVILTSLSKKKEDIKINRHTFASKSFNDSSKRIKLKNYLYQHGQNQRSSSSK